MATRARTLLAAAAFSATLFIPDPAAAAKHNHQTIVVHVYNYANVPSGTLGRAEKRAARIYAAAGIRTLWVDDGVREDSRDTWTPQLTVLLLSRDMAERWIATGHVGDDVLGQALRPAKRAYIFVNRVIGAARNSRDVESILGNVIAHEVGHLVLPTGAHSTSGIMCAELDVSSTVPQRFSDAQGLAIRTIVATEAAIR